MVSTCSKKRNGAVLFFSSSACFKKPLFQELKEMVLFFSFLLLLVSRTAQRKAVRKEMALLLLVQRKEMVLFFSFLLRLVSRTAQRKAGRKENVSILDLPVNQSITLEKSFSLLDKSVMLQGNLNLLFSSAFSSKLSRHTNNLNVPFLIQTRGMAARAAAETMTKALSEVVFQNPGVTIVTASGVVTGAIGTVVEVMTLYKKSRTGIYKKL